MNIDAFWEAIFSENDMQVRAAFGTLDAEERASVFDLLRRIDVDAERIEAQRVAARTGMRAIRSDAAALPAGALDFARELAHDVGRDIRASRGAQRASAKADGSLVTEFDLAADRRLCDGLAARFPGHAVLSEERRSVYAGEEWTWLIDPIDGTTNFTFGFPCWGVLVALLRFGQPVLGVLEFPETEESYWAAIGGGAFRNGARLQADSAATEVQPTQIFGLCSRSIEAGHTRYGTKLRISGSCGYDLALLAAGTIVGTQQMRVYPWDLAAGWVLAAEAGATLRTLNGDVFPLAPGTDCSARSFRVLGAASESLYETWILRILVS
jgi:myo-inositol-1(or 4)-monophosphatase